MNNLKPVDAQAPEEMRALAVRLRRLLGKQGFGGVREVSGACGLNRTTVSYALGGSRAPTWNTVSTLLKCCRIAPDADWRRQQEAAKRAEREWRRRTRARTRDELAAPSPTPPHVASYSPSAPSAPYSPSPPSAPSAPSVPSVPSAPETAGHPGQSAVPGTFTVRAPYGELPPRVRGRDGLLAELREELTGDRDRIQVLHGLGGCGKTTVALGLARLAKDLGHQVFWLSAATQDSLLTGMRQVARDLGVPEARIEDAWSGRSSAMDLVWRALDGATRPWLLVFDNVDEPDRTTSLHGSPGDGTGWIRPGAAGLTLVTTRIGNPAVWGGEATCRPVGVLSPEDGAEVLIDFAGNAGPMADARDLARRLGGMPLALKLAGSYLARAGRGAGLLRRRGAEGGYVRDFAGYARELDRLGTGLLDRGEGAGGPDGDQRRYRRLISGTWEISLDLLAEQGLPEARLLMRLISCFAHAPLPAFLLDLDVLEQSGLFQGPARAESCETALEGLVDLGLLTVEEAARESLPCLTAHPLVLEANALRVQESSGAERERLWHAAASVAVFAARLDSRSLEMWKVWKLVLPHLEAGIRAVPREETESLAAFLWAGRQAHLYAVASNSRDADELFTRLLLERVDELPEGHPVGEFIRRKLAEGVEPAHEAYLSAREKLGEESFGTLSAWAGWASELRHAGRPHEAERELHTLLDVAQRLEMNGTLVIRAEYVQVLAEAGKAEAARAEAHALLSALEAEHVDENDVAVRHHVAHALEEAGLLAEAEQAHRDQLSLLEQAGEQNSVLYLDTASLLCGNLVQQERPAEALEVVGGLLERYDSVPDTRGAVGRGVVKLYQQRGELLYAEGHFEAAAADLGRALEGLLSYLPPHHFAVIDLRLKLVPAHLKRGEHGAALRELDALDSALAHDEVELDGFGHIALLWRARATHEAGSCAAARALYEELLSAGDETIVRLARTGIESCGAASAAGPGGSGPPRDN
ncbi:hypothetical protein AB0N81_18450 [Streptomyces sp. NPDC093510]|uniref:hypothetical protein n=1 Tax=Streptomyces sp. NPDC093510 TaxID=3155199 RepID=UPI0034202B91